MSVARPFPLILPTTAPLVPPQPTYVVNAIQVLFNATVPVPLQFPLILPATAPPVPPLPTSVVRPIQALFNATILALRPFPLIHPATAPPVPPSPMFAVKPIQALFNATILALLLRRLMPVAPLPSPLLPVPAVQFLQLPERLTTVPPPPLP